MTFLVQSGTEPISILYKQYSREREEERNRGGRKYQFPFSLLIKVLLLLSKKAIAFGRPTRFPPAQAVQ